MERKGFTLIELLAVIVILTIISLITVPIVLNMIEESKTEALKETVNSYISSIETSVMLNMLNDTTVSFNNISCSLSGKKMSCTNNISFDVRVKGDTLDDLNITFDTNSVVKTGIFTKNHYCGTYNKEIGIRFNECGLENIDSSKVKFTPSDESWQVTTVEEALHDLYKMVE